MSIISRLFGAGKGPPIDFSFVGTDMHSHFIPGIDDGAKTIDDSLALIRHMRDFGFRKVITTPHIMSDHFKNTPEIILSGLETVREAVRKEGIDIEVDAAAEYYLDDGFVRKLDEEELLTFGERYLLFEVSYINFPENVKEIIFNMQIKGYRPVMAHPERYPFWFGKMDAYREFRDAGVLLQINANSLAGYYGMEAKKTAEKLIDNELVDFIGSDMHKVEHAEAMKRVMREKYFRKLQEFNLVNKHL
jgi:protein-tyrosine phosphatase